MSRPKAAQRVAAATRDLMEYVHQLARDKKLPRDFTHRLGKVAYHAPCHLRAQGVGFKGRDLLRRIPGVTPTSVVECCGHNGTYAMKVEGFEASQRIGGKAFEGMKAAPAQVWATDCPLAALQFQQHAGRKPLHPMTILRRAYEPDGFEQKVEPRKE